MFVTVEENARYDALEMGNRGLGKALVRVRALVSVVVRMVGMCVGVLVRGLLRWSFLNARGIEKKELRVVRENVRDKHGCTYACRQDRAPAKYKTQDANETQGSCASETSERLHKRATP